MKKIRMLIAFIFLLFLGGCSFGEVSYTITFDSNGGSHVANISADGKSKIKMPDDPILEGYEFDGWYFDNDTFKNEFVADSLVKKPITKNITVYAKWIEDIVEEFFTVVFKNSYGEILKTEEVSKNKDATPPSVPNIIGHEFIGWDKAYTNINEDLIITAVYEIINYNIKFYDGEELLDLGFSTYTSLDIRNLPIPEKEGHVFEGWYESSDFSTNEIDNILEGTTGDKVLYAKWALESKVFIVTFKDSNDEVLKTEAVEENGHATPPQNPTKEGYIFIGWDKAYTNIKENLVIFAKYDLINYDIKFYDGSEELSLSPNTYTILDVVELPTPEKDGFVFEGWYDSLSLTNKVTNIKEGSTGDKSLYANWIEGSLVFTVTFKDSDDKVLKIEIVDQGANANPPAAPAIEGYNFTGWDKAYTNVNDNLVLKAEYELANYNINFNDGGLTLDLTPKTYTIFDTVDLPVPVKENHEFDGWYDSPDFTKKVTSIKEGSTGDKAFYVKWISNILIFTVTFKDDDGVVLKTEEVEQNNSATPPSAPVKEGYNFTGWDKAYNNITADIVVTTKYDLIYYDIKFFDGTKQLSLNPTSYTVKEVVNFPTPVKEGYDFVGWYDTNTLVNRVVNLFPGTTGSKSFYAKWEKIEVEDEFVVPTGNFPMSVFFSNNVYQVALGTGAPSSGRLDYDWSSSDENVAKISTYSTITPVTPGFAIITATYKTNTSLKGHMLIKVEGMVVREATASEVNQKTYYTVTFVDENNNVIKTEEVLKGMNATLPTPPKSSGKLFYGWDKSHVNIQTATTIKATYKTGSKSFEGKKVTIIGDSVSTYYGTMPSGYPYFYPYSTSGVGDVNQMWWAQLINKLGMQLLINNSYSGSTLRAIWGGDVAGETDARLAKSHVGNEKPDYIFVFMGLNDCYSVVSVANYRTSYNNMVSKLKAAYPNAEIVLCTLTTGPFTTGKGDVAGYNNVIKQIAQANNFAVLDFEKAINTTNYNNLICDTVHPNLEGMNRLANRAITDFLNYHGIS